MFDVLKQGVAVLGGSFDPIHKGHLALATAAQKVLPVSELRFMPAKQSPHKSGYSVSDAHRLRMLKLALNSQYSFIIDSRELERDGLSYTVLSMRELRTELGADLPIYFVMGWDSLSSIDSWWCWRELFDYVNIAVAARPGYTGFASAELQSEFDSRFRQLDSAQKSASGDIVVLPIRERDIASSAIRAACAAHELDNDSCLPEAVAAYIKQHGLYC